MADLTDLQLADAIRERYGDCDFDPIAMGGNITELLRINPPWEPTRDNLIALCEQAIVQEERWSNRDSASAHVSIGIAWALLIERLNEDGTWTPFDAELVPPTIVLTPQEEQR